MIQKKTKFLFPEYAVVLLDNGRGGKLFTTVRFERDGVWYESNVTSEANVEVAGMGMHGAKDVIRVQDKDLAKFFQLAYKYQTLLKVNAEVQSANIKISPIQISEADRLTLLQLIPLNGLENLI